MESNLTAVQWLEEQIDYISIEELKTQIIIAKEMEKRDKLKCFIEGYKQRAEASNLIFDDASKMYATALFNETFKK
jgi:hypothetical protein